MTCQSLTTFVFSSRSIIDANYLSSSSCASKWYNYIKHGGWFCLRKLRSSPALNCSVRAAGAVGLFVGAAKTQLYMLRELERSGPLPNGSYAVADLSGGQKGPWPPNSITIYYLIFIIFHHVKHKIIWISPLNSHLIPFGPSNNYSQGPRYPSWAKTDFHSVSGQLQCRRLSNHPQSA
jgi:hypothetical protein